MKSMSILLGGGKKGRNGLVRGGADQTERTISHTATNEPHKGGERRHNCASIL